MCGQAVAPDLARVIGDTRAHGLQTQTVVVDASGGQALLGENWPVGRGGSLAFADAKAHILQELDTAMVNAVDSLEK